MSGSPARPSLTRPLLAGMLAVLTVNLLMASLARPSDWPGSCAEQAAALAAAAETTGLLPGGTEQAKPLGAGNDPDLYVRLAPRGSCQVDALVASVPAAGVVSTLTERGWQVSRRSPVVSATTQISGERWDIAVSQAGSGGRATLVLRPTP